MKSVCERGSPAKPEERGRKNRPNLGVSSVAARAGTATSPNQAFYTAANEPKTNMEVPNGNDRQMALDLFDAFGSQEKSLHAHMGGHAGVPQFVGRDPMSSSFGT